MKPVYDALVKQRDDEEKKSGTRKDITWDSLIAACAGASIDLSAESRYRGFGGQPAMGLPAVDFYGYQNYGAAIAEIELDVLTGEVNVAQADILYDAGKSLNPAIDIGQVEGSFIMGIGFLLREEVKFDATNGKLLTGSTWVYLYMHIIICIIYIWGMMMII
jgi:xanthine dehydrogenase molybdopterin-binding subunit B